MRLSKSCISKEEIAAVVQVLEKEYLGMGPLVQKFEIALAQFLGSSGDHVVCVNTGTSALHCAVMALDLKAGDEVLVPSLTYVASFQAVSATGAKPVACDVDGQTGLIDFNDAEKRITKHTKALLYVHYASEFGDLDQMYSWCKKHNLRVIEDAAHSFGCSHGNKKIGSFGDVVCFSFDGIKNITCAEGGALVSRDAKVIEAVRDIRLLAVEKDTEKRYQKKRSWDFDVKRQGFRYHMGEMNAAIGLVQLQRFQREFIEKRMKYAALYRKGLANIKDIQLFTSSQDKGNTIVPHIFPIRVKASQREALKEHLLSKDIEVGLHYKPNHLLSFYRQESLPTTEALYHELVTLPLHPDLSEQDVELVVSEIRKFAGS